jgi:hypothetical protein
MESHDAARRDRDFFAGLRVAARTLRLVAQLEIAETGQLDGLAALERIADLVEEGLHHVLGLALVQADLFEQQFGQLRLGQRRQIFFCILAHLGNLHGPVQIGSQCGLEYGGINVVVINFPALPYLRTNESGIGRIPIGQKTNGFGAYYVRKRAPCFCLAASPMAAMTASTTSSCSVF